MTVDPKAHTQPLTGEVSLPPSLLTPGMVLDGRWEIASLVGRGGMGAVYAARDRELDVEVAVKVLLVGKDGSADAQRRFRREVQLARAITHPNVCRLFDFGIDDARGIVFLTMELVRGTTLRSRIERDVFAQTDAAPIVQQLASALSAAHSAGVIHRDLKSANVMLVGDRAVVMDFGISHRAAEAFAQAETLPAAKGLTAAAGTPGYMAPEQAEGAAPAVSADIYALGAVVYEMLTQKLPAAGASALAAGAKIDARWDAAIMRALASDPAARFATAADFARALAPPRRRFGLVAGLAGGAAAATAIAVALGFAQSSTSTSTPPAVTARADRPAIAVMPFATEGLSPEMLGVVEELLATDLAIGERIVVIGRERLGQLVERDTPGADPSASTRDQLRATGVDLIVTGTTRRNGRQLVITARVLDASSGRTLATVQRERPEGQLAELVLGVHEALLEALALDRYDPAEAIAIRAAVPREPRAATAYARGVIHLRAGDVTAARTNLEEAVAIEPEFALAQAELSLALSKLGYDKLAREAAERAFARVKGLPRARQLLVEARLRIAENNLARAVQIYRSLSDVYPDDTEYTLALAETEVLAGHPADALRTLDTLASNKYLLPRANAVRAMALMDTGDRAGTLTAARAAIDGARKLGLWQIEAGAQLEIAGTSLQLAKLDDARAAIEAARAIYTDHGDKRGLALAYQRGGTIELRANVTDRGLADAQRALALCREIGDRSCENASLTTLAIGQRMANQLDASLASARDAVATALPLGDDRRLIDAYITLGNSELALGHDSAADEQFAAGAKLAKQTGAHAALALALGNRGAIAERLGEPAASAARFAEARDIAAAANDPATAAWADSGVAAAELELDRIADARARMAKIIAANGDPIAVTASHARLALLDARSGPLSDPTPLLRAIADAGDADLAHDLAMDWAILAADRAERPADRATARATLFAARAIARELAVEEERDMPLRMAIIEAAATRAGLAPLPPHIAPPPAPSNSAGSAGSLSPPSISPTSANGSGSAGSASPVAPATPAARAATLAALAKFESSALVLQLFADRERAFALTGAQRREAFLAIARRASLHELRAIAADATARANR